METSETIGKISAALLKAQRDMESAKKDSSNPFFRSKYADYGAVLEACKGPLNDNGIIILQPHTIVTLSDASFVGVVETILLHESGEFIKSETEIRCAKANDPQALGSAITYARRYGLQSLVALPAEDDDGNKASGKQNSEKKTSSFKTNKKSSTEDKPKEDKKKTTLTGRSNKLSGKTEEPKPEVKEPKKEDKKEEAPKKTFRRRRTAGGL